jgi:hypothetical protein
VSVRVIQSNLPVRMGFNRQLITIIKAFLDSSHGRIGKSDLWNRVSL